MKGKIRIIYVGYHMETLLLLYADKRFDVIGTGLIEEFISGYTYNPVNLLFKFIYGLRYRNRYRLLERILLGVWNITSRLATSFYYRYSDYLKAISATKTELIDFSNNREVIDNVATNCVDVMLVCFWSILAEDVINSPKYGTVNIHPSKLPQYRGAVPTLWSLKNGDRESAVTYFVMDKAVDAGSIIGQHAFPINDEDDWQSIELKINEILQATLLSNVMAYVSGKKTPMAQDMRIKSSTAKYFEYMKIDWDRESGKDINNKVNLYPFSVPDDYCHTFLNGRKIVIKKSAFINNKVVLPRLGQYQVQGLTLMIQAKLGIIACKLFSGLRVKDSLLFILKRKGTFI